MNRQIGITGLGRMGTGIAARLLDSGFPVSGFNRTASAASGLIEHGLRFCADLNELAEVQEQPRIIWVMLPSGKVTNDTIGTLSDLLSNGDCIIDGGNSYYRDSLRIADMLAAKHIHFIDMGVSGGIWGHREGFGLMFGASPEAEEMIRPFVKALAPAPDKGWVHAGPPGAGHYSKMVHNAIEYGLMQAYAEGFDLLNSKKEFKIDVSAVSQAWRDGTVIRSWLLDLAAAEFEKDRKLEEVLPRVPDSGEARWAVKESVDLSVSMPAISASLFERFSSRDSLHYQHRILAVLRNAFGGHSVEREKKDD